MTPRWLPLAFAAALGSAGAAKAAEDADCLACHGERDLESEGGRSLFVDGSRLGAAVHGGLSCADCHAGIKELPHPEKLPKVDCAACHSDAVKAFETSVHGATDGPGAADGITCASCHGHAHEIRPSTDGASRVAKRNLATTCGSCHADPEFLARHKVPFARPVEAYQASVHGRAVAAGRASAASCSDCHGSHDIRPARDASSPINHWRVAETCGRCHDAIRKVYAASVHGQAAARGVRDVPVCTDCHGEHTILSPREPGSLVNPARVSSVTCGRCHGDERLVARYNLPVDKVPAFQDSYHGLASRAGSQTVANCASCHGIHNIRASGDPASTVHPANLRATCGGCHPGAGTRFALGPVHVRADTTTEHAVVRWVRLAYWVLIPLTVGLMFVHHAADFLAKLLRGVPRHDSGEQVERMGLHFRIAHGLIVLSFPLLVVTGFALKFPGSWWAAPLLAFEGKMAFRGLLHRAAAIVLLAAVGYHLVHLALVPRDRRILRRLWPRLRDVEDVRAVLRHNFGGKTRLPFFGPFNYAEKVEYWAFAWGTVVMAVSGFVLWFENWSLRNLPTWAIDTATAIHWYEAILATLAIAVWHSYLVIFDPVVYPMDRAWLTGRVPAEHLRATRPAYYRLLRMLAGLRKAKAPGERDP
jgi:cytochrome b subunit of formate dehydrogenase/nitrate/TMAO reductase-like tetraheme cytochrome c subunit